MTPQSRARRRDQQVNAFVLMNALALLLILFIFGIFGEHVSSS